MKEHNQVKQDYATVKTTTETGVRTVDHLQRTFDYVAEHPGESIFVIGAVIVAVAFAPAALTATSALLTAVGSAKLIGAAISILIGVSIFNDKGK